MIIIFECKMTVFKNSKEREVGCNGNKKSNFSFSQVTKRSGFPDNPTTDIIHHGGKKHQQSKEWIGPAVEEITEQSK